MPGDTCQNPFDLVFTGNVARASGDLATMTNGFWGVCAASTPDAIYRYAVPDAGTPMTFIVATGGAGYLRMPNAATCPAGDLGSLCSTPYTYGVQGLYLANHDAGTFFLGLEHETAMPYRLEVQRGPPANDTCATATPLALSTAMVDNSLLESTWGAVDDWYYPGLGGAQLGNYSPGGDLVYSFVAPSTRTYTLSVRSSTTPRVLVFQGVCNPPTGFLAEARDATQAAALTFSGQAGTTYYVIVDGWTATPANFFSLDLR